MTTKMLIHNHEQFLREELARGNPMLIEAAITGLIMAHLADYAAGATNFTDAQLLAIQESKHAGLSS